MSAYDHGRDHAQNGGFNSNRYKNRPWPQHERGGFVYRQNKK